jgi:hypothetical protein
MVLGEQQPETKKVREGCEEFVDEWTITVPQCIGWTQGMDILE